jgi:hypothetical protein
MWHTTFSKRLEDWRNLRLECQGLPLDSALSKINQWWFGAPWSAYYLHWDDQLEWPNPWDLLNDNVYCDLAKSLGIMYTVMLIEHTDVVSCEIIDTNESNLVSVNKEKYILNWDPIAIVNSLPEIKIHRRIDSSHLKYKLG